MHYKKKSQESIESKYGVHNIRELDFVNKKICETNMKKYGCENPFGNNEVIEKIKQYNLKNYGVEYSMQRKEVVEKSKQTCLIKYGVNNYGEIYSKTHTRELSPTWKGGVKYHRVERSSFEYRKWRKDIFKKDFYTCKCCGSKSGNGKTIILNAHHIFNWQDNEYLRYDINNGITLCKECHNKFHSLYGKKNNTKQQLKEFLDNYLDKKIC